MPVEVVWKILTFTILFNLETFGQDLQKNNQVRIQQLEQQVKSQGKIIKNLENKYQGIINLTNRLYPTESCSILKKKKPSTLSGNYSIHPKSLVSSVQVFCDMTSKNGVGVTEIGHDSESKTYVSGHEAPGSYIRKIKYDLPMEKIVAIMKQSLWCEQFIKYQCHDSVMWYYTLQYSWWVSRQGKKMNYWGGAEVNSGKCACGMTNRCDGGGRCNCDKNDNRLREDSGYLKDKNTLPVTELKFGDSAGGNEYGYHTLGKLRCWG